MSEEERRTTRRQSPHPNAADQGAQTQDRRHRTRWLPAPLTHQAELHVVDAASPHHRPPIGAVRGTSGLRGVACSLLLAAASGRQGRREAERVFVRLQLNDDLRCTRQPRGAEVRRQAGMGLAGSMGNAILTSALRAISTWLCDPTCIAKSQARIESWSSEPASTSFLAAVFMACFIISFRSCGR